MLSHRAEELGIKTLMTHQTNKSDAFQTLLSQHQLSWSTMENQKRLVKFYKNFYEAVMSATVRFSEPKANIQVPKQRIMPCLQTIPQAPISSEISVHIADRQQPFSLLSSHRT